MPYLFIKSRKMVFILYGIAIQLAIFLLINPPNKGPNYFSYFQNLWNKLAITLDKIELERVAFTLRNI